MSLLWCEGFDAWSNGSWAGVDHATFPPWDYNNVNFSVSSSYGRNSTRGMYYGSSSSAYVQKNIPARDTLIFGFAMKRTGGYSASANSQNNRMLTFLCGAGISNQITIGSSHTANAFIVRSGTYNGTILGTSATELPLNEWMYIEIKIYFHTTNGYVRILKNNIEILNVQNINTNPCNSGNSGAIQIYAPYWGIYWDDLYVCDTLGAVNNDFLGDVRVDGYLPTADGSENEWIKSTGTVGYQLIDEIQQLPSDYVTSWTDAARQTFKVTVPLVGRQVKGIQLSAFMNNPEGGSKSCQPIIIADAVKYGATPVLFAGAAGKKLDTIWDLNPETSTAWTEQDILDAEFGYEVARNSEAYPGTYAHTGTVSSSGRQKVSSADSGVYSTTGIDATSVKAP